jgi:hypothetical protein
MQSFNTSVNLKIDYRHQEEEELFISIFSGRFLTVVELPQALRRHLEGRTKPHNLPQLFRRRKQRRRRRGFSKEQADAGG